MARDRKVTLPWKAIGRRLFGGAALIAATLAVHSCAHSGDGSGHSPPAPLLALEAHSDHGMVSTGSVEATKAGVRILEMGGNAVDAAVAAAFALGVADPGGSGLGGMTYVLISPAEGPAVAIDGSATVPLAANAAKLLELRNSGEHMGAKAVAVPATLAALNHALERYGTMTLEEVLQPSIEIADRGFRFSLNTVAWTTGYLNEIIVSPYFRYVVLENGEQVPSVGDIMCRPDLAATLRLIAKEGPAIFYRGKIAHRMVADIRARGGSLQAVDLASARVKELRPLRSRYRDAEVISYPWPGGGGEVAEALNILETYPKDFFREDSVDRLHVMIEAFRIANADHARFGPDAARQSIGHVDHLSEEHARERASLITPGSIIPNHILGVTGPSAAMGEHTTHASVADRHGNAVALSQTLCRQYGAKVATPGLGFPYNSCLEFFDFEQPESPYFLQPRKRYATTMAPTVVRRDGQLMILGSAGSDRISPSVVEVISKVIDRNMGIRDAVVAPRVLWNSAIDPARVCIEITPPIKKKHADRLQKLGFEHIFRLEYSDAPARDAGFFGGVNAVSYEPSTGIFSGVGDPRRSGYAEGPRAVAEAEGL
jgi:gamma-glutamyltranspeptidase/glutathione hydrolase